MVMNWLFKEEPAHYSFDALVADKKTAWSGVKNALAQKHLHAVRKGDRIFYYHTGEEKAVIGIAKALGDAYPDRRPVTLAEIKADPSFKDFPLVRISRLSVMPVTDTEWKRIEALANRSGKAGKAEP